MNHEETIEETVPILIQGRLSKNGSVGTGLERLIHRQKCATQEAEVRAERIKKLLGNIDVSVDVHHRSGSWAVVSLQGGKTDFIKFVDLDQRSLREIAFFLRQYDRKNVKIDANPFDKQMLNEEIYRI